MATIRKRGETWQAQVRRTGYSPISKSFSSRADALAWARDKERAIDRADLPCARRDLKGLTLRDLLDRYECEIVPRKRGAAQERSKISLMRSHPIAAASLDQVSGPMVASYRDDRLKSVSSGTVRRELALLQHCLETARKEWGVPLAFNPVRSIRLPAPAKARDRRLQPSELDDFWKAVGRARASWVRAFVILAIETAMRRGELLSLAWEDVDLKNRTARLRMTKNGYERTVPLTPAALCALSSLSRLDERVFPVSAIAVRQAWERIVRRAGLTNLRMHDLRHEAVSRFFEAGLNMAEVALVSGHRDIRMLARYTHLRPEKIALKLQMLMPSNA